MGPVKGSGRQRPGVGDEGPSLEKGSGLQSDGEAGQSLVLVPWVGVCRAGGPSPEDVAASCSSW